MATSISTIRVALFTLAIAGAGSAILPGSQAAADVLGVDVGLSGQEVQFGFEEFSASGSGDKSETFTSSLGNANSVTLEFTGTNGWRDRGDTVHPIGDVAEDIVFDSASLPVTISNLKAGTYYVRTYHHDTPHDHGDINLRLTDAVKTDQLMFGPVAQSHGAVGGPAGPMTTLPMRVEANGTDDVTIDVVNLGTVATLAGIELADSLPSALKVDIGKGKTGAAGNDVQAGFQPFSMENTVGGDYTSSPQEHWFFTELANAGSARVRLAAPDGQLGFRDRADVTHSLGDLLEDHVFPKNDDGLELTLGSLKPGMYSMTTYMHDSEHDRDTVDVRVTDSLGTRAVASGIDQTTGTSPTAVAQATFDFYSNGIDPVTVHLDEATAIDAWLNGFAVEQSTVSPSLRVDFGWQNPAFDLASGFEAFTNSNQNGADGQSIQFASELGTAGEVTVQVEGNSDWLGWRDRGDVYGAELGDVSEDFVFNGEWLEVVLEDLQPGAYLMTSYHADPGFNHGAVDVLVSDALGNDRLVATDILMPEPMNVEPGFATYTLYADGINPVTVRFAESNPAGSSTYVMLGGFALTAVPEPSALLLGLLGVFGLLVPRRRKYPA